MKINVSRKSFVYRVARGQVLEDKQKSLCSFFWRCLLMLFIGWPLLGALWLFTAGIAVLFAGIPTSDVLEPDAPWERLFKKIAPWPTFRGHRIWPITILLIGWLGHVLYLCPELAIALAGIAFVTAFFVLCEKALNRVASWRKARKEKVAHHEPSVWRLILAWLKAKKQKVCPLIEFVD